MPRKVALKRPTPSSPEKWAYAIGFKCDGVLRKYGVDGVDYLMMSRVK